MKTPEVLRREIENKLRGLRYTVRIGRDNVIIVEAVDDSIERVKWNIAQRINGITFLNQNHTSRMNWNRIGIRHGIPQPGKEEHKCTITFKLKEKT